MTTEDKSIEIANFLGINVHKFSFAKDPSYVRVILGTEEEFDWDCIEYFDPHIDYNWLMKAWEKFRDINFNGETSNPAYWDIGRWKDKVGSAILRKPILEAFEALYEGINWLKSAQHRD